MARQDFVVKEAIVVDKEVLGVVNTRNQYRQCNPAPEAGKNRDIKHLGLGSLTILPVMEPHITRTPGFHEYF
ncbi:hypothetical protein [Robiginitalea sp. SC105]|uniref:hypothetical protein n=1 Tax=Robiginitalea sp. SC105 TaxID=2762332 RepID=UPI00163AF607|nr:hypothetical protein [Robiginitalea sp. SC105]MBC2840579.1 hypothetical protein [Robiginitalea sp. SC105]